MRILFIYILLCANLFLYAHPATTVDTSIQNLNFSHSKQKNHGIRYTLHLSHQNEKNRYQIAWEKSDTQTFKPPLSKNLHVNKYFFTYSRLFAPQQNISISYALIDDNLAKETDGGKIYGIAYGYKTLLLKQYFSNYHHFNVYQSEVVFRGKRKFSFATLRYGLIAKYLHIHERTPNSFTKYAKENYFTPGIKIHLQKSKTYAQIGAFFGKRIFAIMNNGFSIQHHAMEFHKHYMLSLGKKLKNWELKLGYIYLKADEIPLQNKNVAVENVVLHLSYHY